MSDQKFTTEEREYAYKLMRALSLREKGMSYSVIAEKVGWSSQQVSGRIRDYKQLSLKEKSSQNLNE